MNNFHFPPPYIINIKEGVQDITFEHPLLVLLLLIIL